MPTTAPALGMTMPDEVANRNALGGALHGTHNVCRTSRCQTESCEGADGYRHLSNLRILVLRYPWIEPRRVCWRPEPPKTIDKLAEIYHFSVGLSRSVQGRFSPSHEKWGHQRGHPPTFKSDGPISGLNIEKVTKIALLIG